MASKISYYYKTYICKIFFINSNCDLAVDWGCLRGQVEEVEGS